MPGAVSFWLSRLRCWTLRTIALHKTLSTLLCLHVYLSSLGVVLFSTFNTQGQPPIICPKVTLSDFPQSPQLKFFAEPYSWRLFGVGRVLSCEFRTKDSSLSEYWVSTFFQERSSHSISISNLPQFRNPFCMLYFINNTILLSSASCLVISVSLPRCCLFDIFEKGTDLIWFQPIPCLDVWPCPKHSLNWAMLSNLSTARQGARSALNFCLFQVFLLSLDSICVYKVLAFGHP